MKIFTPFPGEYVASALQRGNELLGIKSLKYEEFNFRPIIKSFSTTNMYDDYKFRAEMAFECAPFFTERKIFEEVLNNHTLYPIVKALGRVGRLAAATPFTWKKICIDCVFDDFLSYGTTFVRRGHILRCVGICSTHASELIEVCPTCSIPLRKHAISKLNVCFLKYKVPIYQHNSRRHLLSKFVAELLAYSGPLIAPDRLHKHVEHRLSIKHKTRNNFHQLINKELGFTEKRDYTVTQRDEARNTNTSVMLAFLAFDNVENYLDWVTNETN